MALHDASFEDYWNPLTVDDRPENTIRAYVVTRLTREYIHNIYDRAPELHQKILKLIAEDQFATRQYFNQEQIKVEDQPSQVDDLFLSWRFWCNGRTGLVGGTRKQLKKDIKTNLLFYIGLLHE